MISDRDRGSASEIRAALYARVSTVNKGQDVGLQLDELRQVSDIMSRSTMRRRLREEGLWPTSPRGDRGT